MGGYLPKKNIFFWNLAFLLKISLGYAILATLGVGGPVDPQIWMSLKTLDFWYKIDPF
jgi:hypothetical protein